MWTSIYKTDLTCSRGCISTYSYTCVCVLRSTHKRVFIFAENGSFMMFIYTWEPTQRKEKMDDTNKDNKKAKAKSTRTNKRPRKISQHYYNCAEEDKERRSNYSNNSSPLAKHEHKPVGADTWQSTTAAPGRTRRVTRGNAHLWLYYMALFTGPGPYSGRCGWQCEFPWCYRPVPDFIERIGRPGFDSACEWERASGAIKCRLYGEF